MEKKLHFWLFISLLSCSLNHLFANNTVPTNKMEDLSDCELPLPDSFRIAGMGSGYVSLAWNQNNIGDDYLLTTFQENNNGGFDSIHAILVYDVDTYTINNLSSPKAYKFRIQPVCPDGKVNTNVSAYTPPVNLILELTTNGVRPNIYQYVPCENIPIPQKPTDWIGFQLFDLSTNSSATFQFEVTPGGLASGRVKRVTFPGENQILVAANENEIWPTNIPVEADLIFKVGKVAGPNDLEFYEK
ncbi:MAG: hypothetical protein JNJ57_10535, partial [Saprospiraceae bacterium]|nr:hypothetical protein [Saprospiraceae bacterium]